ncbi:MAG TPA: hypothetical protein VLK78_05220, partial [Candidatus Angelobacter sp.]|nr:hypothetical protein [Candidatus Angelobacter sp.]
MQPKKREKYGPLKSRIKQIVPPISEQGSRPVKRTVTGTHERTRRGEEAAPPRFTPQAIKLKDRALENRDPDFGDIETVYSPVQLMEPGASVPGREIGTNRDYGSSKNSALNLKPTPKRIAETLVLAEILSVPRAKRPHQPLGYKKR